ncbi:MAG: SCO family protein [Crocinitomicaceae bacterium]
MIKIAVSKIYHLVILSLLFLACSEKKDVTAENKPAPLPYLGDMGVDHVIPPFRFLDQDSIWRSNKDFQNKVWVTEFFFSTCPSICPIMNKQMLRLQGEFADWEENLQLISFTINPSFDTPSILKEHAQKNKVSTKNWSFLTGVQEAKVHELGVKSFLVHAGKDEEEAGGYAHSGAFTLVDKSGHVRGVYQITNPDGDADEKEYQRLKSDLENLLIHEYNLSSRKD